MEDVNSPRPHRIDIPNLVVSRSPAPSSVRSGNTEICPIALVPFRDLNEDEIVTLPCGHRFQEDALITNEAYQDLPLRCPMCREIYQPRNDIRRLPNLPTHRREIFLSRLPPLLRDELREAQSHVVLNSFLLNPSIDFGHAFAYDLFFGQIFHMIAIILLVCVCLADGDYFCNPENITQSVMQRLFRSWEVVRLFLFSISYIFTILFAQFYQIDMAKRRIHEEIPIGFDTVETTDQSQISYILASKCILQIPYRNFGSFSLAFEEDRKYALAFMGCLMITSIVFDVSILISFHYDFSRMWYSIVKLILVVVVFMMPMHKANIVEHLSFFIRTLLSKIPSTQFKLRMAQ